MKIINGNKDNFESLISDEVVLVDFYAKWCGPCKMLGPVLEEIANERDSVKIVKIDIDENTELTKKYGIMSVPTLILFKNGQIIDIKNGFMPKPILTNWLNEKK